MYIYQLPRSSLFLVWSRSFVRSCGLSWWYVDYVPGLCTNYVNVIEVCFPCTYLYTRTPFPIFIVHRSSSFFIVLHRSSSFIVRHRFSISFAISFPVIIETPACVFGGGFLVKPPFGECRQAASTAASLLTRRRRTLHAYPAETD